MLFIALIIYLIAWIPLKILVKSIVFLTNLELPIIHLMMFLLSVGLASVVALFARSYQPEILPVLKTIRRTQGVRWIILTTAIISGAFFLITLIDKSEMKYIFFPIAAISLLNWLGIEVWPRWLLDEDNPAMTVIPRQEMPEIRFEIIKNFNWTDQEHDYKLEMVIRRALYEQLKDTIPPEDYDTWLKAMVTYGLSGEIRELSQKLAKYGRPFGSVEEIMLVLGFIQNNIKLQNEKNSAPRFPLVTLVDQQGDSRDISILAAAVLRCMGYSSALVLISDHFALGIGRVEGLAGIALAGTLNRYVYCGISDEGWRIGELPDELKDRPIKIIPFYTLQEDNAVVRQE